jgi:hypothetical protein
MKFTLSCSLSLRYILTFLSHTRPSVISDLFSYGNFVWITNSCMLHALPVSLSTNFSNGFECIENSREWLLQNNLPWDVRELFQGTRMEGLRKNRSILALDTGWWGPDKIPRPLETRSSRCVLWRIIKSSLITHCCMRSWDWCEIKLRTWSD